MLNLNLNLKFDSDLKSGILKSCTKNEDHSLRGCGAFLLLLFALLFSKYS